MTYRSSGRTLATVADRAASNGGENIAEASSRTSTAGSGSATRATTAMIVMRARSQQIMTVRYGYRSAIETRTEPPSSQGAKLIAKAIAETATEPVSWYTSAVTAARAM